MRAKYFHLLVPLFFLFSCENIKQSEAKQRKIDSLQYRLNQLESRIAEGQKFVLAVIYYKQGTYNMTDNKFENVSDYIEYTQIEEHNNGITETEKYKILDNLENELRNRCGLTLHSIIKRECLVFDSYIEASEYKQNLLNKRP